MSRFPTTLRHDTIIQWRNGFYYVTFVMAAFWALLLPQASELNLRWLMPAMAIGNLLKGDKKARRLVRKRHLHIDRIPQCIHRT